MLTPAIVMLCVCICLPAFYSWRVLRLETSSLAGWLATVLEAGLVVALVVAVGRWDMAGYFTRAVIVGVFTAAMMRSFARHRARPLLVPRNGGGRACRAPLLSLITLSLVVGYVLSGILTPDRARNVAFPLAEGRFMVVQGGGASVINYHAGHPRQNFAVDITALNAWGFRAEGLAPRQLTRYAIFGASVVSPCAGTVIDVRRHLPDLSPPARDEANPRGNFVVVDCGPFAIVLAHLQAGSVIAAIGDPLALGAPVGKVGNSGNTSEPHLHVHAVDRDNASAVALTFDSRWPVRNSVFERAGSSR